MFETFEDKGKIFTQVVSKTPVKVLILTSSHRIQGFIHVKKDERLKDELDAPVPFLAVTDAEIFDPNGATLLFRANFMAVNRSQIVGVIPEDDLDAANWGD